jgi:hypothetical protein
MADNDRAKLPTLLASTALRLALGRLPTAQAPAPKDWPIRPVPDASPLYGQNFTGRWRAKTFTKNLDTATAAAEAGRRFYTAADALEAAQQAAEVTHERRRGLAVVIENTLTRAAIELDQAQRERHQRQFDFERQQQLENLQSAKTGLALQAEIAEATAQLLAIGRAQEDARAHDERQQELAAEDFRIEMFRRDIAQLDLIAEIRERIAAMRPPKPAAPADNTPDAFRRHYAMGLEVHRNRGEADRRIEEIYMRAAAERRPLTDGEIEQVDQIADAASGAEDEVRRSSASDLK